MREPIIRPPLSLAPPLLPNRFSSGTNPTLPAWNKASNEELYEELRRLRGMISNSDAPSQEQTAPQGPALWAPDDDGTYDASILRQVPYAEAANSSDFATPLVAPMEVDATPEASTKNGVVVDEFEFKVNLFTILFHFNALDCVIG